MKPSLDLRVYLVTDRNLSRGRSNVEVAVEAVRGGATLVQYRDKHLDDDAFAEEARRLLEALAPYRVPLVVNDRVQVARAVGAPAVHVGRSDMSVQEARAILGPDVVIGVSAESVEDARRAAEEGADYVAASPVWTTATKPELTRGLGPDGVAAIRAAVDLPLVGIGGIHVGNAAEVIAAGADGVAVVTALTLAEDVRAAASALRGVVDEALASRGG